VSRICVVAGASKSGARAPPARLSGRRQSIVGDRAFTMTSLYYLILSLLTSLQTTSAIISDGSFHGRFVGHGMHGTHGHVSANHIHYSYHPPSHIAFICRYCNHKTLYPVFHSAPPTYIYKFRESNSRYSMLLTGLSLYNLGRCCGPHHHSSLYTPRAEEQCSLQIIDKHTFEETRFPCFMMSSFMESSNNSKLFVGRPIPKTDDANGTEPTEKPFSVDITTANIDVSSYLTKNESVMVIGYDQVCMIWHNITMNKERHNIPCALLKQYADTMKPAGMPFYIGLPLFLCAAVSVYICCYFCCRKKKDQKEEMPLYQNSVYRYCSDKK
jgi:hypothetical protein